MEVVHGVPGKIQFKHNAKLVKCLLEVKMCLRFGQYLEGIFFLFMVQFIRNTNLTYSCSIMIAKSSGSGLSDPSGMAPRHLKKILKHNLAKKMLFSSPQVLLQGQENLGRIDSKKNLFFSYFDHKRRKINT